MNLLTRLMLIVSIVVTLTDLAWYYRLKRNPERLTLPWTIAVIVVTIVPIAIIVWVHMGQLLLATP
jgi:hypothetical protein